MSKDNKDSLDLVVSVGGFFDRSRDSSWRKPDWICVWRDRDYLYLDVGAGEINFHKRLNKAALDEIIERLQNARDLVWTADGQNKHKLKLAGELDND